MKRVQVIGRRKCQGLIGLHNFAGDDWDVKFVGITKKTWVPAYLKLPDDDPVIKCFGELSDLLGTEFPERLKPLEKFVCSVYCPNGPSTIPALRWEMFRPKNLEGQMLPPTRAALMPHIARKLHHNA